MTRIKHDIGNLKSCFALKSNERDAVAEFVEDLRQRYDPMIREIILFGSKVRGNDRKDSDIDILIVLNKLSWKIKKAISELATQENIKYNVLISTIRYDTETWDVPVIRHSPFGRAVREEGILI